MVFSSELQLVFCGYKIIFEHLKRRISTGGDAFWSFCETRCMELPFLTNRRSANQRVSSCLLKTKTYYRVRKNPPFDINPQTDETSSHLTMFQNVFNIIFRSTHSVGCFPTDFQTVILNAFLGVFAYSRKASITFVAFICPHVSAWLTLDRFTWVDSGDFMKIWR